MNIYNNKKTFFHRLKSSCKKEWSEYTNHKFLYNLVSNKLADKNFKNYLIKWTKENNLQPAIKNKLDEWLNDNLNDWDITRDAPYFGFLIPNEKAKYFYVWMDAFETTFGDNIWEARFPLVVFRQIPNHHGPGTRPYPGPQTSSMLGTTALRRTFISL